MGRNFIRPSPIDDTPAVIVNKFSSGTPNQTVLENTSDKKILSGALTSGVLATALSITGAGVIYTAYVTRQDATARTLRMKVTLDGVVVFDSTTTSVGNTTQGLLAIGAQQSDFTVLQAPGMGFKSSCLIEIASSVTETDKIALHTTYRTN